MSLLNLSLRDDLRFRRIDGGKLCAVSELKAGLSSQYAPSWYFLWCRECIFW
jgi:hypothetical protein